MSESEAIEARITELQAKVCELKTEVRELKTEVRELKAEKKQERPKKVYNKLNAQSEIERLMFICQTQGFQSAKQIAKALKKTYLEASLKTRQKYHTRSYPFRFAYIEAAFSIRYLLNTGFFES